MNLETPKPPAPLVIHDINGEPIVTVHHNHTVTVHQPDKANEAARLFWQTVQQYGGAHCVNHD